MSISSLSINRPVLATVLSLFIIIIGVMGYSFLGVRDYPSVDPPVISVRTSYPGANAAVIETQITEPLEASINGIPGIRSLTSVCTDGASIITIEFTLDIPLETAANDVRNKVSEAMRRLPQNVDPPVVSKADADAQPIFGVTIESADRNVIDLSEYAEINFKERLQTVSGVSSVEVQGSRRMSVRLKMDPILLAAYSLTPSDVRTAVGRENIELPSGRIEGSNTELVIRTLGRLITIDDFNQLILSQKDGKIVRFSDIGKAVIEPETTRQILKRNGVVMVACALIPQPGSNYIEIVDNAKIAIEQIQKDLPSDITVRTSFDNTKYIRQSIKEVWITIIEAFLLVVLIIFVFLRSWRTTMIPVLAIPISLIGSFFIMYICGFSINILTLLALVLAIGLVVDDAIVVMENIYSKIEEGMPPKEAALEGSKEIFFAVIATTIALAAVFFPIIFLQGVTGRLFREFSLVLAGSVIISSFVALTFTPMICAKFLNNSITEKKLYKKTEPFFVGMVNMYGKALAIFLRFRYVAWVIIALSFSLIFWLWQSISSEMAPLEDRSQITVSSTAPEGASYDYMLRYADLVSAKIDSSVPEQEGGHLEIVGRSSTVNTAMFRIILKDGDQRERKQGDIADDLTKKLSQMTGAKSIVSQQQTFGSTRGGLPVQYVLQSQNLEQMKEALPRFLNEVGRSDVFSVYDVNLRFTKPELTVSINRDRASSLGVSIENIAQTLQLAMGEQRIGYYIKNGKQYQILSMFDRSRKAEPTDLTNIYVRNMQGESIQLDNLVTISESSTPPRLYRYNRFVAATVSAGLSKGHTLGDGIKEMDKIAENTLDDTFSTALSGSSKDFAESSSSLLFAFGFALVLIYLVLAAQFESFRDPLIIMLTVPLALVGALISLYFTDQTMNIFSQIGIIMLIGLVTKNGILLVEFANQKKEEGMPVLEAIRMAAMSRFRPILMTSLSTILGTLPMALATGAGSESRISMGVAVVGGLMCATFLTLFVIPAIYTYFSKSNVIKTIRIKNDTLVK